MVEELLVFGTFVIALVTVIGILLTHQRTRESIDLTRGELNARLRPWIGISSIKTRTFFNPNTGVQIAQDQFNQLNQQQRNNLGVTHTQHVIKFKNSGMLLARNVRLRSLHRNLGLNDPSPTVRDLQNIGFGNPTVLMPDEIIDNLFTVPLQLPTERTVFVYEIIYEYGDNQQGSYTAIFETTRRDRGLSVIDSTAS